jgi:hypothetical protein
MSIALASRGYEAGSAATGGGGTGPSGVVIFFVLLNTGTGDLESGVDLSAAGVIKISTNGLAFNNRVGAAPTSVGRGSTTTSSTTASSPPATARSS